MGSLSGSRRRELRSRLCKQDHACQQCKLRIDRCNALDMRTTNWSWQHRNILQQLGPERHEGFTTTEGRTASLENRAFCKLAQSPRSFLADLGCHFAASEQQEQTGHLELQLAWSAGSAVRLPGTVGRIDCTRATSTTVTGGPHTATASRLHNRTSC